MFDLPEMTDASVAPVHYSVLIVDDDPAKRYTTSRLLQTRGFAVVEAETGEEALRLVRQKRFDLAILDVELPDLDGFEVCRQIKSHHQTASLRVLHLSGHRINSQDQGQRWPSGAEDYLSVPVEPEVLIATVRSLLRKQSGKNELAHTVESRGSH